MLKQAAQMSVTHVPYRSGAPAIAAAARNSDGTVVTNVPREHVAFEDADGHRIPAAKAASGCGSDVPPRSRWARARGATPSRSP